MQILEQEYRPVSFESLNEDEKRYLADALIQRLRLDRWQLRVNKVMSPFDSPGEAPGFFSVGTGRSEPLESSHVMVVYAKPSYELGIGRFVIALGSGLYSDWCKANAYTALPHLDRLIHGMRSEAKVFHSKLSGYGSAKRVKMRRSEYVTSEQGEAALDVLELCVIAKFSGTI